MSQDFNLREGGKKKFNDYNSMMSSYAGMHLEKSIRYSDKRFRRIEQLSEGDQTIVSYDNSQSEFARSIPHKRLQSMVSYAKQQRSTILINKWGLFARKMMIKNNKDSVMTMLNFSHQEVRYALKKLPK